MTALGNLQAGGRILASVAQGVAPLAAYKGADQTLTTLTLTNDNALFVPLAANAAYFMACFLRYEGGASGTSDLKWAWTGPSGFGMNYELIGNAAGGGGTSGFVRGIAGSTAGTTGAGNVWGMSMLGTVTTGSATGNLQLQWCTNTSPAVATTVHSGSILALWQVA